ncbi:MAG: hypothetical protein HY221_00730 [Candidatus Sungbacteria bacterium]|uniref:Uncharacterized protein n=1 Tax=Candidatus Sungiibacteriota bacterium TaxID=2750080 RepID=A0A932R193_9BACT|nr:hypothetical protein [Candidatus Sungbacteria bacterium]
MPKKLMEQDNTARQQWLIDTLHALRGYFRTRRPKEADNLVEIGIKDAEGMIIGCMDPREDLKKRLHLAEGEYFSAVTPGGFSDTQEAALKAKLSFMAENVPKARNAILVGQPTAAPISFCTASSPTNRKEKNGT